ncbi:MAG: T9SS C-terminal target domain-containing protein [Calditrichaeota bacterium]|nr:MAG: T9SS C-terminal target domain-containing protein [Calditrichota bacterium]
MMRQVDYLEQALALLPTDTRFPFEEGQPDYAWADEQAALVVIKQEGVNLWATLQWRHPLLNDVRHVDNALPNDKVRVHYSTPDYDLVATTAMQSTDAMYSLYTWKFGKYLVAMNASPETKYELELPADRPASTMDLISKQEIDLSTNPIIQPQNTLVLEWPGDFQVTSIADDTIVPQVYSLKQNYPNPFNPTTTIEYSIAQPENVRITLFNALGQKVKVLVDEHQLSGTHKLTMNANDLSSSVYFYSIQAGTFTETRKLLLIK